MKVREIWPQASRLDPAAPLMVVTRAGSKRTLHSYLSLNRLDLVITFTPESTRAMSTETSTEGPIVALEWMCIEDGKSS